MSRWSRRTSRRVSSNAATSSSGLHAEGAGEPAQLAVAAELGPHWPRACAPARRRWRPPDPGTGGCVSAPTSADGAPSRARNGSPRTGAQPAFVRRSRRRRAPAAIRAWTGCAATSSVRPCTSWSICTVNSTSRSPPRPSLISRSLSGAGIRSSTRRRICWQSLTKLSAGTPSTRTGGSCPYTPVRAPGRPPPGGP